MRVRAYDPTIGRFIWHDPLGRARLFFADQPDAYAGNNPVSNVDPSGQRYTTGNGGGDPQPKHYSPKKTRTTTRRGTPKKTCDRSCQVKNAKGISKSAERMFTFEGDLITILGGLVLGSVDN